jgi:hypothetical protein
MKEMKQVIPGMDLPVSHRSNEGAHEIDGGRIGDKIPFYRTAYGLCVTRWQLSIIDRLRIALSGNIWHCAQIANAPLQPFNLHAECPLSYTEEVVKRYALNGPRVQVLLSGTDMLAVDGLGEVGVVQCIRGEYRINGQKELGVFKTENEAIAALEKSARAKNKTALKKL